MSETPLPAESAKTESAETETAETATSAEPLRLVHLLRALTVELDLFGAEFASRNKLHPTDLRALIHLLDAARAGRVVTPGRLGEALRLNSAGTTGLVDRLERLGLIRRERDPRDRRRVHLVVEQRAMELGEGFFGGLIGELVAAMGEFEPAELATVRRFLETVTEAVTGAVTGAVASASPGVRTARGTS